ncbi:unnamed protein product [Caenorhabditis nigoni]
MLASLMTSTSGVVEHAGKTPVLDRRRLSETCEEEMRRRTAVQERQERQQQLKQVKIWKKCGRRKRAERNRHAPNNCVERSFFGFNNHKSYFYH